MATLFTSEVVSTGDDAGEMFDAGIAIFFGEPCPDALAEVSVVHRGAVGPQRDPRAGDVLRVGDAEVTVAAVGHLAGENLRSLGHLVLYMDPEEDQKLLPGAVTTVGRLPRPAAGDRIELIGTV
ncbi:MAG: PTS sorbitol transporter subunit IIA [Micrococcales bacterium]|nr:PTS sorbitol transporter subunit IIA [Micrococcales bacterium]